MNACTIEPVIYPGTQEVLAWCDRGALRAYSQGPLLENTEKATHKAGQQLQKLFLQETILSFYLLHPF